MTSRIVEALVAVLSLLARTIQLFYIDDIGNTRLHAQYCAIATLVRRLAGALACVPIHCFSAQMTVQKPNLPAVGWLKK